MAHWWTWCATGPLSKMSDWNQSPFSGSYLFCSTNESDFQAGGAGTGTTQVLIPASCGAAASFWMREIELSARM